MAPTMLPRAPAAASAALAAMHARAYDGRVQPEYACALIEAPRGRVWLQLRPADARHAAGLLTCFGGRLEAGEDDVGCLTRELTEEVGWTPARLRAACELWQGERFIARFHHAGVVAALRAREPGHVAVAAPMSALPGLPVSPWHAAVIAAWRAGRARVDLEPRDRRPPAG